MLSALIALTYIQVSWIKDAVNINNKHFNNVVNNVLIDVCKEIETNETIYQISNEVYSYKDIKKSRNISDSISLINNMSLPDSDANFSYTKQSSFYKENNRKVIDTTIKAYIGDSLILNKSNKFTQTRNDLVKTEDLEKHISNKLGEKALFVEKIVNSLLDYNEDINKRVNKEQIKSLLSNHLKINDIDIGFEFSVNDKNQNSIFCTDLFKNSNCDKIYTHRLFPNDIKNSQYYLAVNFPSKATYIFQSLLLMIISSIIIILIILTIFTATLIIIFRQKKLSEMKSDFVSNMTHELKTPISTISLASQMLSDDQVSNSKDYIKNISKIIKDETMRLSMQVEKVLQTSIIDKGMLKLKIENIDIHDIIKKILDNFEIRVKNENGTIELNLEAQKSIIKADKVHITNVLVNLCENALKYKQEIPEIKIETKNIANSIIINVIDTGIGISKENYKKVFEKFYRVSTGNLHDVKGFGLGLSYVKKIVEEHNGTITLESKLKKGSVFSIKLPLND